MATLEVAFPDQLLTEADALEVTAASKERLGNARINAVPQQFRTTDQDGLPAGGRGSAQVLQIEEARDLLIEAQQLRLRATANRDLAAALEGAPDLKPGLAQISVVEGQTTADLVFSFLSGGTIDGIDITGVGDTGQVVGYFDLAGTTRTFQMVGLTSNTHYDCELVASGPGGESRTPFTIDTLPVAAPPAALTFRSASSAATDAPTAGPVVPKPTGLTVGDFMVAVAFSADGNPASLTPPSATGTWTEFLPLHVGDTSGGIFQRVWFKVATAADVSAASFAFTHDTSVASTRVTILAIPGATYIAASAVGTVGTTATTLSAPSVNSPVTNGILFEMFGWVTSPAASRTVTVSGPTLVSQGTTPAFWLGQGIWRSAVTATGQTGAQTGTMSGAVVASDTLSFLVAADGGDAVVTGLTAAITNVLTNTVDITASWSTTGDSHQVDVTGDGQPGFTVTGTSFTRTLARQAADYTVTVEVTPVRSGVASATKYTTGPYTVPALAGGTGSLPPRTTVNSFVDVLNNTSYADKNYVHQGDGGGAQGAVVMHSTADGTGAAPVAPGAINTSVNLTNLTLDGGTQNRQTAFGNTWRATDIDVKRYGGAIDVGTGNPNNQHGWYVRQGIWRRVHLFAPLVRTGGTYGVHVRAGSITNNLWGECYDMTDESGFNGLIGGTEITSITWQNYHKVGVPGEFIIGGLAGGAHKQATFTGCIWEGQLRLEGSWSIGLKFVACRCKVLVDHSSGVKDLTGLTVTG